MLMTEDQLGRDFSNLSTAASNIDDTYKKFVSLSNMTGYARNGALYFDDITLENLTQCPCNETGC